MISKSFNHLAGAKIVKTRKGYAVRFPWLSWRAFEGDSATVWASLVALYDKQEGSKG